MAPNNKLRAVVALIYNEDKTKVLSVSRKYDTTLVGLPGGKVDPTDVDEHGNVDDLGALKRELLEETGLTVLTAVHVFTRTDESSTYPPMKGKAYLARVYECTVTGTICPAPGETGKVEYVTWQRLFEGPFAEYNKALYNHIQSIKINK